MIETILNLQPALMTAPQSPQTFAIILFVALLLGSLIGVERELHNRSAGIRTNALVCVGTAIFVAMAFYLPPPWEPARITAQVVSGIGFLGAGLIWRNGTSVSGLDTAATVWCTAAVGAVVGAGRLVEACIGAMMVLMLNIVLRKFTKNFFTLGKQATISHTRFDIWLDANSDDEKRIACEAIAEALNATKKFNWISSNVDWDDASNNTTLHFTFACLKGVDSVDEWLVQFSNAAKIVRWTWREEPHIG